MALVLIISASAIFILFRQTSSVEAKDSKKQKEQPSTRQEPKDSLLDKGTKTSSPSAAPLASPSNDPPPQGDAGDVHTDPSMVHLPTLFANFKDTGSAPPEESSKQIPVEQFAKMIEAEADSLPGQDFRTLEQALILSQNLDIATIGLDFVKSDNSRLRNLGFELLTVASTSNVSFFKPNEFYMAFAERGFASEPFLIEIISSAENDFCREWACELYTDIFYHNQNPEDPRRIQIDNVKKAEKILYENMSKLLGDRGQLEKMLAAKISPADQIRAAWGHERRYPLKLLQTVRILDNMNSGNIIASSSQAAKIVSTYNFNYDILNWLDGKPVPLPRMPDDILLKFMMHAVFADNTDNTFNWIHKKDGGFTREDAEKALASQDTTEIRRMAKELRKILCLVLRGKLLLGLGNHELQLLRYFYSAKWGHPGTCGYPGKGKLLVIRNNTGRPAPLNLSSADADPKKMLTGDRAGDMLTPEGSENFLVPSQSSFMWILPEGAFKLSVNKDNTVLKPEDLLVFETRILDVKDHDITVIIN
ncbi:MAG: hypothetical protein JW808_02730 [Victivallales bacterium]|nr:hypothetical protein [Victivallales bacterium]